MPVPNTCPRCGAQRPEDGPTGLCPGCLLRLSLVAGSVEESRDAAETCQPAARAFGRSNGPERPPSDAGPVSRVSSVLDALAESIGPVPRVLLRDGPADEARPLRPLSEEMPDRAVEPGRYQLFGEIARGGMGVVLQGRDVDLGRELAIKVLREKYRDDPEVVRRFVEEAQIGGQLQHPGIVPVYELGQFADRRPYIAMKLIKGRTLAALLADRASPADDRARFLTIFEQVCQAMAYAHARGVIHRDLKPSNVMVGRFGEVQVMDWGLAKVLDRGGVADEERALRSRDEREEVRTVRTGSEVGASRAGSVLGTPQYMAPEQARGAIDTLDERADVFSLGSILCEILTGAPVYVGGEDDELYGRAGRADLSDALARLDDSGADAELVGLARRCLAAAPPDRPRDAGVVLAGLTAYLEGVQQRLRRAELAQAEAGARAEEEQKRRLLADELAREAQARAEEEQKRRLLADELAREAQARAVEERKRRLLTVALAATVLVVALLGGGGWAWMARDRAARAARTAAEVNKALVSASLLFDRAREAGDDSALWLEAIGTARRAEALLARGEGGADLQGRVRALLTTIARERDQAETAAKDRRMVERLAEIHADYALLLNRRRQDEQYAQAFRAYGIDVDSLSPAEAGARIAARPIATELAGAVDLWAFTRRRRARPSDREGTRHLVAVARAADPDPWRNRLRDAVDLMSTDRDRARVALEQLAASADLDGLSGPSVERLVWALAELGGGETAISFARRAQQAHRDDLWINYNLAGVMMRAGRFDEAVRYYSVAVAIRPRSHHVLVALGKALHRGGHLEEAAATLREALRLRTDDSAARLALEAVLKDSGAPEATDAEAHAAGHPDPH